MAVLFDRREMVPDFYSQSVENVADSLHVGWFLVVMDMPNREDYFVLYRCFDLTLNNTWLRKPELFLDRRRVRGAELMLRDKRKVFIDCTGVEDALDVTMAQRSELDYLIYNDLLSYADLILNGNPEEYLKNAARSHGLED